MAEEYTLRIAEAIRKAVGSIPSQNEPPWPGQPHVFNIERLTIHIQIKGDSWPQ